MEIFSSRPCVICERETHYLFLNKPVCSACKKFYHRNRNNRQALSEECPNGGRCSVENDSAYRRCRFCRLEKSLSVFSSLTGQNVAVEKIQTLKLEPLNYTNVKSEKWLIAACSAYHSFNELSLKNYDQRHETLRFADSEEAWHWFLNERVNPWTYICLNFVKKLPGFSCLPVEQRCQSFGKYVFPITMIRCFQEATQSQGTLFLGVNAETQAQLCYHLPFLTRTSDELDGIAYVLSHGLKMTQAEHALFSAYMFFEEPYNEPFFNLLASCRVTDSHRMLQIKRLADHLKDVCFLYGQDFMDFALSQKPSFYTASPKLYQEIIDFLSGRCDRKSSPEITLS